ncbi:hypothetical protein ER308_18045 [Egibacter rhizosphaerae]|uniref:Small multi-drug export protein n=1 Tax=Egibacter rhizosphaerae TaxID=1670831 RepID=A0A411YLQ0_9ACTN|nr:small multi-drug export protein [Egibacter rhizosphaerae]QBI22107.1 hypothetical protein ER308_18045 [Egibacter rhizosphaerae]
MDVLDLLRDWAAQGALGYLAVLIGAAVPWVELLVVVPPAILLDLDPTLVAIVAFVGNFLPVLGLVAGWSVILRRREARGKAAPGSAESGRYARGRRVARRYGVPGLALLGPLLTGIHLAALIALGLGASRREVVIWTAGSLALWAAGTALATVGGMTAVGG